MNSFSRHFVWLAPAIAISAGFTSAAAGLPTEAAITLSIAILTATWWITEAVPIPAASLVPIALLPLFGVLPAKTTVAQSYGHPLVLLLLGGFLLSKAMEKCGVHHRIAYGLVRLCSSGGFRQIILGFMLAASLLSMWISNTATTLMLLPIALAVISKIGEEQDMRRIAGAPLMLGMAFAANVGGLGSPIGTPPNLVFMEQYPRFGGDNMSFSHWMRHGIPVVLVMLPLIWLWITRKVPRSLKVSLPKSGPWRPEERRTLIVFGCTVLAWITRSEPYGGWSEWFDLPGANDATVAFIAVIILFCLPNGIKTEKGVGRLLDWDTAKEIPWGMLILFGGGICLANGIEQSGLSLMIAGSLEVITTLPVIGSIALICLVMTFLTEVTSNTASTILMLPILGTVAQSSGIDPALLMLPATLSASCAFMFPVATAPNAVVFGTGMFSVRHMMREGVVLNFIGAFVITLLTWATLKCF